MRLGLFPLAAGSVLSIAVTGALPGCGRKSPVEPSPICTVAITPASRTFASEGGSGDVAVAAPTGCDWASAVSHGWLAIGAGVAGSGNGTVTYTVAAHAGAEARAGVITIGGQAHAVSQAGHVTPVVCRVELSPAAASFGKDAADGSFAVTVATGCEWLASSSAAWLVVTGSGRGNGSGVVTYSVTRNLAIEPRTATIGVADRTFTVTQAGDAGLCEYAVSPVDLRPCMAGATLTATVTTQAACPWTATPDVPWLTVAGGASGSGSGTITMTVGDNYDAPRSGRVLVRWSTPTLGQNIRVDQAGCRYAVSRPTLAFQSPGGPGTFDVLQQSDPTTCGGPTQDRCVWSAVASAPWITLAGSAPRSGDGRVDFTVSPNPTADSRAGTITVRDKVVAITQAGRP
jgi:hypothetical protein